MTKSFGEYVAQIRKDSGVSQEALGDEVGVSQATISRLERSADVPDDARLIAKLSRALDMPVREFMADFDLPRGLGSYQVDGFYAFCPNPACGTNKVTRAPNGSLTLHWRSGEFYGQDTFEETNFCGACGTELLKQCPSCERPLRDAGSKYCVTCGAQINDRPTEDDLAVLRKLHPPLAQPDDDELPF